MKTMLRCGVVGLSLAIVSLVYASRLLASEPVASSESRSEDKTFSGTVTVVNPNEKTIAVKNFWSTKTFIPAENCRISFENKPNVSLGELHPGHRVEVHYQNVKGVLIAEKISQHDVNIKGHITAIDQAKRTLTLKTKGTNKNFTLAEDCTVVLKDDRVGTPENLKLGHAVNIAYESVNGTLVARKIEQKSETFAGSIRAIDAGTKTVTAKSFMAEKKFHLADDCRIVVESKANAGLKDLRIGDRVAFSYEDANGVLVTDRIGRDSTMPESDSAQAASTPNPNR